MKQDILKLVKSGLEKIPELEEFLNDEIIEKAVERTKDNKYGHFTSNIAMRFAKRTNKNPRELAKIQAISHGNTTNYLPQHIVERTVKYQNDAIRYCR